MGSFNMSFSVGINLFAFMLGLIARDYGFSTMYSVTGALVLAGCVIFTYKYFFQSGQGVESLATIKSGDTVLVVSPDEKSFMVTVHEGKSLSSHMGILDFSSVIGKNWGGTAVSSLGNHFVLLPPTIEQKIMKLRRTTQIVYPKDAAFVLFRTDVRSGTRVVEAATGTGALTVALANSVAPSGRVYTYEKRKEFIGNAEDNVRRAGLSDYVEFHCGDARDGFAQKDVDVVVIDLPSPWYGIPSAYEAFTPRGEAGKHITDL